MDSTLQVAPATYGYGPLLDEEQEEEPEGDRTAWAKCRQCLVESYVAYTWTFVRHGFQMVSLPPFAFASSRFSI